MIGRLIGRKRIDVPCTVEISNTFDSLGAHVRFSDGTIVHPGDEVIVHGAPVAVPYGEVREFKRTATITRASLLERAFVKATGDLELMELCEFSFSGRGTV